MSIIFLLTAIISFLGGIFFLRIRQKYNDIEKLEKTRSVLKGIEAETEQYYNWMDKFIGDRLRDKKEKILYKKFVFNENYFTFYEKNIDQIGYINDKNLLSNIVNLYNDQKSFKDSLLFLKEYLDKDTELGLQEKILKSSIYLKKLSTVINFTKNNVLNDTNFNDLPYKIEQIKKELKTHTDHLRNQFNQIEEELHEVKKGIENEEEKIQINIDKKKEEINKTDKINKFIQCIRRIKLSYKRIKLKITKKKKRF